MTDRAITIKPDSLQKRFAKTIRGSLAQRVLLISIALLGLPLLVHTFFLYHREYRENLDDTFLTLRSLGESRALYLEQMIQNQKIYLQAILEKLPNDPEAQKEFLRFQAREYQVDDLFYVSFDDLQKIQCDDLFCKDPAFLPLLERSRDRSDFVLINPHAVEKNEWIYVGRKFISSNQTEAALVIATSVEHIFRELATQEFSPYPLRISLIDDTNQIFLSSPSGLEGEQFEKNTETIEWEAVSDQANCYFFEHHQDEYLATRTPIEQTQYSLMLDVPERSIVNLQLQDYFFRIASLLFFICVIGGGVLVWLTRRISRPFQALCRVMERVSDGGVHVRYLEDQMGFEINVLGRQMNGMLDAMLEHQRQAERERLIRERLAEELRIGHQIQTSMLPTDFSEVGSLEIAPGYLAAREVSGDFYDLVVLNDGRILLAIADAADKGISACLYSLSFRSILRTAANTQQDLAAIVNLSNDLLMKDTQATSFFISAWIGIFDPRTRELSYCNQGHPPAFIRKENGQVIELSAHGMALGIEKIQAQVEKCNLSVHDLLFLYTDGVIEAVDVDGQFFGKERLKEFLSRSRKNPPVKMIDQLLDEIHLFSSGTLQVDDLTLLAIRVV